MRKSIFAFAISFFLCLAGFGCVPAPERLTPGPQAPPSSPAAVFGSATALNIGESAVFDDGLAVLLSDINDSRCPQDVQCVWEGELAPVLRLSGGDLKGESEEIFGTVRGLVRTVGVYGLTLSDVTTGSVALVVTKSLDEAAASAGKIRVTSPQAGQVVTSPLVVTGEARGAWYFEADFPVKLLDADGRLLAAVPARAQADWMTEDFVPFRAELEFAVPATATGTLVLEKDNPSDLPEYADELRIPVDFSAAAGAVRGIRLYYYDPDKDRDESGNVMCSRQGLVAVDRRMPLTKTPVQDAVRELLEGRLTEAEETAGITTEFPLSGVGLKGAVLRDGVLTLEFVDPESRTGGGACRVGVLWFQIEATAMQFPEVRSVRFIPEELFQP